MVILLVIIGWLILAIDIVQNTPKRPAKYRRGHISHLRCIALAIIILALVIAIV